MAELTPQAPQQTTSLLDQVRQNLAKMSAPVAAPGSVLGETAAIQKISQAASGRAVPGAGAGAEPGRSRQAELAVVDQVRRGQEELAKSAAIQDLSMAQQQKSIEDAKEFKNKQLSEEQLATREKFLDTQRNILNEYSQGQRQLDFNKDKAKLEQLGFSMRLSNASYMDELEKQATLANLSDALSFEEELMKAIFADEQDLLRDDLEFRALMAADSRTFTNELSNISLELAMDMAKAENRAASERAGWNGLSTLVEAGAKAYERRPTTTMTSTGYNQGEGPEALSYEETKQVSSWGGGGPR